jgi:hypothetical protein
MKEYDEMKVENERNDEESWYWTSGESWKIPLPQKDKRESNKLFMPTQKTKIMDWQTYQYSRIIAATTIQVSESVRKSCQL